MTTPQRGPARAAGAALACVLLSMSGCSSDVLRSVGTRVEEFTQNVAAEIDVLWVVDNSNSMSEEQDALGANFQAFIGNLQTSDVDYQIGVISTDVTEGGVLNNAGGTAIITPTTPNAETAFLDNIRVGILGASQEKGFEATTTALGIGAGWTPGTSPSPPAQNAGFIRSSAALFIIMVSDEDDGSFGPVKYYKRVLESLKGPGNEALISVSAIVGPPVNPDGTGGGCVEPGFGRAFPGDRYVQLAGDTGGIFASICEPFNESLAELSITAAGLKSVFPLESTPNLSGTVTCAGQPTGAICVRVNGTSVPAGGRDGWTYDDGLNAIVFGVDVVPPPQAIVEVEFRDTVAGAVP